MENRKGLPTIKRLGVYGGTFSPPHLGHAHAAKAFLNDGDIDELVVIPTFVTPLKDREEQTTAEDRLQMCRLAFSFSQSITVSDLEIQRGGKSYTAQTLAALSSPDVALSFLCGTDMLLSMDTWYHPEEIFRLARIVCMRREDAPENGALLMEKAASYKERFGAVIDFLDVPPLALSSSEVRERLKNGKGAEGLLSPSVLAYIREKRLYK